DAANERTCTVGGLTVKESSFLPFSSLGSILLSLTSIAYVVELLTKESMTCCFLLSIWYLKKAPRNRGFRLLLNYNLFYIFHPVTVRCAFDAQCSYRSIRRQCDVDCRKTVLGDSSLHPCAHLCVRHHEVTSFIDDGLALHFK